MLNCHCFLLSVVRGRARKLLHPGVGGRGGAVIWLIFWLPFSTEDIAQGMGEGGS